MIMKFALLLGSIVVPASAAPGFELHAGFCDVNGGKCQEAYRGFGESVEMCEQRCLEFPAGAGACTAVEYWHLKKRLSMCKLFACEGGITRALKAPANNVECLIKTESSNAALRSSFGGAGGGASPSPAPAPTPLPTPAPTPLPTPAPTPLTSPPPSASPFPPGKAPTPPPPSASPVCGTVLFQTDVALPTGAPLLSREPAPNDPVATSLIIQGTGVGPNPFASGIAVGRDYAGADIIDTLAEPGAIRAQIFTNFSVEKTVKVRATIFEKSTTTAPVYSGEVEFQSKSVTGSFPNGVENQEVTDVIVPIEQNMMIMATIKRSSMYIVGIVAEVPDFNSTLGDTAWGLLSVKPVELGNPTKPITVRNFAPGTSVMYFDAFSCLMGCPVTAGIFFNTTISIELLSKCQPPSAPPPPVCGTVLFQTDVALPTGAPLLSREPAPNDPVATSLIIQGTGVGPNPFASGIAVGRDYAGADIIDTLAEPGAIRAQIFTNFSVEKTVKVRATIFEVDESFPQGFNTMAPPVYSGQVEFQSKSFTGSFPNDVEDQEATDVIVPIEQFSVATIMRSSMYNVGIWAEVPDFNSTLGDTAWGLLSVKPVELHGNPTKPITVRNFAPGTSVMYLDAFSCLTGCSVDPAVARRRLKSSIPETGNAVSKKIPA